MLNIENNYKFNNNDIIIVGCSGGPDSMALLDMLIKIRDKYNLTIIVAHVNYNVREESVLEENYVRDYSKSNNLIFEGLINVIQVEKDLQKHIEAMFIVLIKIRY